MPALNKPKAVLEQIAAAAAFEHPGEVGLHLGAM
jgi:hypothetical protein